MLLLYTRVIDCGNLRPVKRKAVWEDVKISDFNVRVFLPSTTNVGDIGEDTTNLYRTHVIIVFTKNCMPASSHGCLILPLKRVRDCQRII